MFKQLKKYINYFYGLPQHFDWRAYLDHNPDLPKAGINERRSAIEHFLTHGKYENRQYSDLAGPKISLPHDFNWRSYLKQNPDLPKAGINKKHSAIKHYLEHGQYECREYSDKNYEPARKISASELASMTKQIFNFKYKPRISVVMSVYNTAPMFLVLAIKSVIQQNYSNWELCIVDDASTKPETLKVLRKYQDFDSRIKIVFSKQNKQVSLATNEAIALATGDYVAFLDHNDLLKPHALFTVTKYINQHQQAKLFFSDEEKISECNKPKAFFLKPGFNYFYLESTNYISHLTVFERDFLSQLDGCRKGFEGAQDYDLLLRAVDTIPANKIVHIPEILYSRRDVNDSLNNDNLTSSSSNGVKALNEHFMRTKVPAVANPFKMGTFYKTMYTIPEPQPGITIIIPTRDRIDLLKPCVESILTKTQYKNYDIIVVDNGSTELETKNYLSELNLKSNIQILVLDIPFNHSSLNNEAVKIAKGDYLCILNNDTRVINESWLNEMLSLAMRKNVAAVGAKLYYNNDTIQHLGMLLGMHGVVGQFMNRMPKEYLGEGFVTLATRNSQAVSGACLFIKKSIFTEVGGFDEDFPADHNDVDLCIRLLKRGYQNVVTPHAELYHHETASRPRHDDPEYAESRKRSYELLVDQHIHYLISDPYFHPKLAENDPALVSLKMRFNKMKEEALAEV